MTTRVIVAASDHDANLLYATRLWAPDPFIYFEHRGKKHVVLSDLEIDRGKKVATVDRVLSLTRCQKALKDRGVKQPGLGDVLNHVLHELRVRTIEVPNSFPVGIARKLRRIRVVPVAEPFYPARQVKTTQEIKHLERSLYLAQMGMKAAVDVLRISRIGRDGFLYWRGRKLLSEDVRGLINATIAGLGGEGGNTIVAGGNQACDPHDSGHGPLKAHWPVILDIFPRDVSTGYFGDITRTVVRGRASERVKKMYAVVSMAQHLAYDKLRDGVDGMTIHDGIVDLFKREGFNTGKKNGRMQGFFHGTGHGLGLDIHEPIRMGGVSSTLYTGNVVTVEPGLYYWGIGGVRLEDVVVIKPRGIQILTSFPKQLEL